MIPSTHEDCGQKRCIISQCNEGVEQVQDLSASIICIGHYRDQRQRYFALGQIREKVYGKEQCVGLACPTKTNEMGSVEETDGYHITRQHTVRAIRLVDYN
jgi:hypothetical protein